MPQSVAYPRPASKFLVHLLPGISSPASGRPVPEDSNLALKSVRPARRGRAAGGPVSSRLCPVPRRVKGLVQLPAADGCATPTKARANKDRPAHNAPADAPSSRRRKNAALQWPKEPGKGCRRASLSRRRWKGARLHFCEAARGRGSPDASAPWPMGFRPPGLRRFVFRFLRRTDALRGSIIFARPRRLLYKQTRLLCRGGEGRN